MKKSKNIQANTPRPYLSFSQLSLWERDKELYRRSYIEGIKQPENQYLRLGKALADRLETGVKTNNKLIEYLDIFMPTYPKIEFEIEADFEGIPVLGKLDGFKRRGLIIGEYKTGKKWNQSMVDKSTQLTFYAMLVWLKYKRMPSEICLHWAKTEINEDGKLVINGDIKTFKTIRTVSDIILMRGRIKKCWDGIQEMCSKYEMSKMW